MRIAFLRSVFIALTFLFILTSCRWRSVRGNGEIATTNRSERDFKSVRTGGSFDVYLTQGDNFEIKITGDENLLRYVETKVENGVLRIHTRKGVNIRPTEDMKVHITAPRFAEVSLAGSGKIVAETNLTSDSKIKFSIAGSGDILMKEVNAPQVAVNIAGSGKAEAAGATRDIDIDVAGSGDVIMKNLKAENAKVEIAGSGNVWLYASLKLDVRVAGGGDIHYYGNPTDIKSKLAGSGNLIKEE
ncbi:DUF2807 domain-containing protein [Lacibacter luteus]|uniref:DUF2807 domain-containing protein n=1 Tax=Lacibacter luteus TaxID=2508719 RepID=A0A4Q1CEG7_9BACT|nr:head GIN domain-containing protein [Lacibacter luteus]RXK57826.1 DUF2807 domain-containing protein [Lacibacter luteus]